MRSNPFPHIGDAAVRVDYFEMFNWALFFFFFDIIFPILLDPLGLKIELLGLEYDDFCEVMIFFIFPLIVIIYSDEMSLEAYVYGFFFYSVIGSVKVLSMVLAFVSSVMGLLLLILILIEFLDLDEGDIDQDFEITDYTLEK